MKIAIGGFATTVFAFLAIATAPYAVASPDTDFLDSLASKGLSVPPQAKNGVISAGHSVCRSFADGATVKDVVAAIAKDGFGGNQSLAATFVTTATKALCPEVAGHLG